MGAFFVVYKLCDLICGVTYIEARSQDGDAADSRISKDDGGSARGNPDPAETQGYRSAVGDGSACAC